MPNTWTAKDERQYEHVRESAERAGRNLRDAKEVAARTVNQQRRLEGRTENERTMGTGNPNASLDERSKDELLNRAKEIGIRGRSRMTKQALITAIRTA